MSPNEQYEGVRRFVYQVCFKFHRRYGGDLDEIISLAHYQYTQAVLKHDPTRAKFITYVGYIVWMKLLDAHITAIQKLNGFRRNIGARLEAIPSRTGFDLDRFVQELSDDAGHAIRLATSSRWPRNMAPKIRRKLTRHILRKQGWNDQRVVSAFTEVQEAL